MKKIFFKKKNFFYKSFIYICIFFLIFYLIYYFFLQKSKYFDIPLNHNSFYIIPDQKGGKIIPNLDKEGLHLSSKYQNDSNFINNENLIYSIQIISNNNFNYINDKRLELIKNNQFFSSNNLFIVFLKNSFNSEYFLLFKNFNSRSDALKYCKKNPLFLTKCVIVNVQNLN